MVGNIETTETGTLCHKDEVLFEMSQSDKLNDKLSSSVLCDESMHHACEVEVFENNDNVDKIDVLDLLQTYEKVFIEKVDIEKTLRETTEKLNVCNIELNNKENNMTALLGDNEYLRTENIKIKNEMKQIKTNYVISDFEGEMNYTKVNKELDDHREDFSQFRKFIYDEITCIKNKLNADYGLSTSNEKSNDCIDVDSHNLQLQVTKLKGECLKKDKIIDIITQNHTVINKEKTSESYDKNIQLYNRYTQLPTEECVRSKESNLNCRYPNDKLSPEWKTINQKKVKSKSLNSDIHFNKSLLTPNRYEALYQPADPNTEVNDDNPDSRNWNNAFKSQETVGKKIHASHVRPDVVINHHPENDIKIFNKAGMVS